MQTAITRRISAKFSECELTHLERLPIAVELATTQHEGYEATLRSLGLSVIQLPQDDDLPDSVFVEDAAVVFDEVAVITRPGAESRRPETAVVANALAPFRELKSLNEPATLDGGDVLVLGRSVYVGLSSRTNSEGLAQMTAILTPLGYSVHGVRVGGCLHLKSAVTRAGTDVLLINPEWVDSGLFEGWRLIEVDPSEAMAANILWVGGGAVYPLGFPKTLTRLREAGIDPMLVDYSEIAKAEGAVTCCSLIFK